MIPTSIGWGKLILVFAVVMQIASNILVSCRLANTVQSSLMTVRERSLLASLLNALHIVLSMQPISLKQSQMTNGGKNVPFVWIPFSWQWPFVSLSSPDIYCGSSQLVCVECAVTWEIPPLNVWCKQHRLTDRLPIRARSCSEAPTGRTDHNVNTGAQCSVLISRQTFDGNDHMMEFYLKVGIFIHSKNCSCDPRVSKTNNQQHFFRMVILDIQLFSHVFFYLFKLRCFHRMTEWIFFIDKFRELAGREFLWLHHILHFHWTMRTIRLGLRSILITKYFFQKIS